jgi:ubiquilin
MDPAAMAGMMDMLTPEMMTQMVDSNPMLKTLVDSNPQMKMLLSNPQLMKQMVSSLSQSTPLPT